MNEPKDYELPRAERRPKTCDEMIGGLVIHLLFGFGLGWGSHWVFTSLWG